MAGRRTSKLGKEYFKDLSPEQRTFFVGFLEGTNTKEVQRKASGEQRKRHVVAVIPFSEIPSAATAVATDYYLCTATKQALGIAKTIDSNLAKFGIEATPAAGNVSSSNFFPALAVVTLINATNPIASTTNRSRYSNKPIDLKATRSGSIPFGRNKTASVTSDYNSQVQVIAGEARGKTYGEGKVSSISFQPEIFKPSGAALAEGGAVTAGIPAF